MANKGRYCWGDPDFEDFVVTHRKMLDALKADAYAETSRALADSGVPPADWDFKFLIEQGKSCREKLRAKVDAEWNSELDVKYKAVCSAAIQTGAYERLIESGLLDLARQGR